MTEDEINDAYHIIENALDQIRLGYMPGKILTTTAIEALEDLKAAALGNKRPAADNVIDFPGITRHRLPTASMLETIAAATPAYAFVICWPADGSKPTYHSNTGDMPVILMRLQQFIHHFYNGHLKGIVP